MELLDKYNVVWDTPSRDYNGSMPIGNGDIGLNVWFESSGELLFYISKTDAWSENARLLKLGRLRVKLTPNPLAENVSFRQILRLREGEILIEVGKGPKAVTLKLQKLDDFIARSTDPLPHRTFGACIQGTGLKSENPTILKSTAEQKQYILSIYPLCAQNYWQGGLELSLMMLDYYACTQDDIFARETLLPLASEIPMRTVGGEKLLLPAWPKNWNVDFKLHAPHCTVLEGTFRDGKLQRLTVTPGHRRKNVEIIQ